MFTFSIPNLAPFQDGVLLLPTCFLGSLQAFSWINLNAVLIGVSPFEPPINRWTPPLKFLHVRKGITINLFSHFHGLIPDTNYDHLECFVMLTTHSETHSALRV